MTDERELLPCPFCGSPVEMRPAQCKGDADYIVHLPKVGGHDCGATQFSNFNSDQSVTALWNTRAAISAMESMEPSEAMIEAGLHARVPGGAEVWHWLPTDKGERPHQTARNVIRCALEAAMRSTAVRENSNDR